MNITIVGCGKIGSTILKSLENEGHDITAIDNNPDVILQITNTFDIMCVCGNGTDCDTLSEASIQKCDLFIAVTGSDELNMLSCFMARSMGAGHTIARIRNPEYNDQSLDYMCKQLGLSMSINPELLAARELFDLLKLPVAAKVDIFSGRNFEMVELKLKDDSTLDGMTLIELRKKYQIKFLVCAVLRGEEIYIPDGNFILKSGDRIGITASPSEMLKLFKKMGHMKKHTKNVIILGGNRTGFYLAKMLLNRGHSVKIIEIKKDRCEELSNALNGAVIINGDGAKQELLLEEGLADCDAFVSLTGIDEQNILLSYFAASQNVSKVISKVDRDEFRPIAEHLGLESIVSPRKAIADVLVRYARGLQNSLDSKVETLYKIMDDKAEALEFIVGSDCEIANIPLKELKLRKNMLVAGITRSRKIIIPTGDDVILPDDRVIILAAGIRINDLSDIAE
jgi:trk system potassium uptake protein TrkA